MNHRQKSILLLLLSLLILFTACSMTEQDLVSKQEPLVASISNLEKETLALEEDKQVEEKDIANQQLELPSHTESKKYLVDPKTYRILPVDHQEEKVVLITIDDAPKGKTTEQLLDILDKYEAKAIFFVNGHLAKPNVETLKEIAKRGHLIGNHTWWHSYLRQEPPEKVREEIVTLNDFIEEQLEERPVYFRPPFGQNSEISRAVIKEENMQTMNWSVGSLDWELKTPAEITQQVISTLHPGANILFHDKQITADAFDDTLKQIKEAGYQFVLPTEIIVAE